MAAAVFFVAVFTIYGWLRPGYSAVSLFVSELSLDPGGWVQIVNFVVTGVLVLVLGRGLAAHFRTGPASRIGPILIQIIGVSLLLSGPFITDPSAMVEPTTTHGVVHGVCGAVVFSLAPISCFVFYRRFRRDPAWQMLAGWTLTAGVGLAVGVGLLKVSQQPGTALFDWRGLVQRIVLVTFMAWLFTVADRLRRSTPR